ncbi:hypothetical protein TW95_gp1565 [Pandoravirus inopinatum]|uniref:Uncharacterized protein n=1 Tax=Pandoravirus inopinatum TaxID=1605721 RepID=A0A0B5J3X1_9VIRU|nr:hypothetical protein TW95_gp1565 [Pandoravirus inopinatum]AJF98299.1 hypothetical protein [Pandoravirus inopinatum]
MSFSAEPIVDSSAVPAEACDQAKPNDTASVAPSPATAGTLEPDQEKTGATIESDKAPETSPSTPSTETHAPLSNEASESEASLAAEAGEANGSGGESSGQGEKRKEPDALADAPPTQDDGAGNGGDDADAAPAKKQKTEGDAVDEPTSAALASFE